MLDEAPHGLLQLLIDPCHVFRERQGDSHGNMVVRATPFFLHRYCLEEDTIILQN